MSRATRLRDDLAADARDRRAREAEIDELAAEIHRYTAEIQVAAAAIRRANRGEAPGE